MRVYSFQVENILRTILIELSRESNFYLFIFYLYSNKGKEKDESYKGGSLSLLNQRT
jgi:hypothetical protein